MLWFFKNFALLYIQHFAVCFAEQPCVTGCDNSLPLFHAAQQIALAHIIQFTQHIVQKHHRVLARDALRRGGLRQLQAQHSRALLALTCKQLCLPAAPG